MKKVLSVIIPVYNMEKYIRQCLESLMIKEVLDKIEILVVLDGSTGLKRLRWNMQKHIHIPSG